LYFDKRKALEDRLRRTALGVPRRLDGRINAIGHAAPGSRTSNNYCTMERETSVGLTQDHEWSGIRLVLTA
jgi:hypothetical protein